MVLSDCFSSPGRGRRINSHTLTHGIVGGVFPCINLLYAVDRCSRGFVHLFSVESDVWRG